MSYMFPNYVWMFKFSDWKRSMTTFDFTFLKQKLTSRKNTKELRMKSI